MRRITALVLLSCFSSNVYAADKCTRALAVTSPCDGVLLPPEWAAEYTEQKAVTLPKLALELDTCSKRAKIETESLAGQLVIERAYAKKLEDLLSRGTAPAQVPKAEEAPWYQAPLFVFIGGVLVGGGLVIGASAVR